MESENEEFTFTSIGFQAERVLRKLIGNRKVAIDTPSLFEVSRIGISDILERSEIPFPVINANDSAPSLVVTTTKYAFEAGFVARKAASIRGVEASCRLSQVQNSIIGSDPIDMVNLTVGPNPMNIEPSQPVAKIMSVPDGNTQIFLPIGPTSRPPPKPSSATCPNENSGFRAIIQNFPDIFSGYKICLGHMINRSNVEAQLNVDEQQDKERECDSNAGHTDKPDSDTHREKVDHRLGELATFDRRARGK